MENLEFKRAHSSQAIRFPAIMGILNLTPDSFYDGGRFQGDDVYLKQAEKMLNEGADMIDVGGVSSRPGAEEVGEEEELRRIVEPIRQLRSHFPHALISVDTYRSKVAREVIAAGAHIINDISGGTFDVDMARTMTSLQVPYILMHIKGTPRNMQQYPIYEDVVQEVGDFFRKQLQHFREAGLQSTIILDPGFGFGKTLEHNYQLLAGLDKFQELGCPLLLGVSRKSMINRVLQTKPDDALNGTSVLHTLALLKGVQILRVHDVKAAKEAVKLVSAYQKFAIH